DNVATGLLYTGIDATTRRRRAAETLVRVGLGHRLLHLPNQLSGGERQRVAIARAIVHEPAIVLADEPTGNLDGATGETIVELIFEAAGHAGATLVLVTHNAELAGRCSRTVVMEDGRLKDPAG
ncbi:MAG: ATP-binding cassette domain-containing protein, partial [Rhodospirillaceae bacterium]|nr:ATP-binding cassette domain-containing protein [Rhodospirillaceae bacterium]